MRSQQLGSVLVLCGAMLFGAGEALALDPIASDPFTQATCKALGATSHRTIAEPDSFGYGTTLVTAFQVGRIYNGGACATGFATSTDNGASWVTGLLPGITKYAGAGTYDRVSDAAVAYDARHNVWLVSTLAFRELPGGGLVNFHVLTSRSTDGGLTWANPVLTDGASMGADKNWIVCDNSPASPFYGNCYTQWDDFGAGNKLYISTSHDGGLTWGPPRSNEAGVLGGQPLVRPDGIVVVPTADADETAIGAFSSADGGNSWSAVTTIATIRHQLVAGSLREGPLPSAEIDGNGTVYVAWTDCRFRKACKTNDIVYATSRDAFGTSWSKVTRVPIDSPNSGIDHFIPGLAVNAADRNNVRIGLTYYFYKANSTALGVGFISSTNGGKSWTNAVEVTAPAAAFPASWTPDTSQGRMVGDYISTSFAADQNAHGFIVIANPPTTGAASSCTGGQDNCEQFIASFAARPGAGTLVAPTGPVLFTGLGGSKAQSLWRLVDNNGKRHR